MSTEFVTREQWGAIPPRSRSANTAFAHLTAHYGGPSPWGGGEMDHSRCASIVRGYQRFHMYSRGWSDIAYNSLVCPHGTRFQGRDVPYRSAANGTNTGNYRSAATCALIGAGDPLTTEMKHGFLDEAERMNLPLNRVHSDWKGTACPGDPLRDWIKSGAHRPGGTKPKPPDIDWAKLRIFAAKALRGPLGEQPTIYRNSHSLRIALLQQVLNLITNAGLDVDGKWGPKTEQAVKNFQKFFKLEADGIFGPKSRFVACVVLDKIIAGEL